MLALDRRVLVIPLEERLQSRTSNLVTLAKIMFPAVHQIIRDTRAQFHTESHDIRIYFSDTTAAEPTTNTTAPTTTTLRTVSRLLAIRQ
jgi:hypothetical protein